MKGYYNNARSTAAAIDSEGWLSARVLAIRLPTAILNNRQDKRYDNPRRRENIYPKEIEDFLYTHPKVSDVQVIGVPDKTLAKK
jgi:fatty-acyl-CoA synthase